jgi:hypothetical protein
VWAARPAGTEPADPILEDLDPLGLPEPFGVVKEQREGQGIDLGRVDGPLLEIRLQGVDPARVQVPVRP